MLVYEAVVSTGNDWKCACDGEMVNVFEIERRFWMWLCLALVGKLNIGVSPGCVVESVVDLAKCLW